VSEQKSSITPQATVQSIGQINVYIETTDPAKYSYLGWGGHLIPGSVATWPDGTEWHYVTTHLGASGTWVELGVYGYEYNSYLTVYSYDSRLDAGQPLYVGNPPIHPSSSSDNGAIIIVTGYI